MSIFTLFLGIMIGYFIKGEIQGNWFWTPSQRNLWKDFKNIPFTTWKKLKDQSCEGEVYISKCNTYKLYYLHSTNNVRFSLHAGDKLLFEEKDFNGPLARLHKQIFNLPIDGKYHYQRKSI